MEMVAIKDALALLIEKLSDEVRIKEGKMVVIKNRIILVQQE